MELDSKRRLRASYKADTPCARRPPELGRPRRQGEREWTGKEKCQPTKLPSGDPMRQLLKYRLLNSIHFPVSYLEQKKLFLRWKKETTKAREPTAKVISSSPSAEEQSPRVADWSPA